MKIAYDNQIFNMQAYGGISRYIINIANSLAKDNNQVKIFAGLHQNKYLSNSFPSTIMSKEITYPSRGHGKITSLNTSFMNKLIKNWSPEIIHKTYYFNNKSLKNPTVITVHDMIHEIFPNNFSRKDKTTEFKRYAVNQADHIIAVSNSTKQDLIEIFGINDSKISVIHHGIDLLENISSEKSQLFLEPFLLYVGQRKGYKNFINLLEGFAKSEAVSEFRILAFGGGEFTNDELSIIKKLNLLEKVIHVSGNDSVLVELYRTASLFVYPSLYEGFGMPILEAMLYNCPVICSHTSSLPEVAGDAVNYFNPIDSISIGQSIDNILSNLSERKRLIELGKKRVSQFSWDKCASETLKVYQKLI